MNQAQQAPPPPAGFKPAGIVKWARISPVAPPFIHTQRRRGRRAAGAAYERKAQAHFCEEFGDFYLPSPWIEFSTPASGRPRWCQPDGLLFRPSEGQITLVEFKLQHTPDAWWQTNQLYLPVLANIFPPSLWAYSILEVVKWFDPATYFPWRFRLVPHPALLDANAFGVHIWKR